LPRFRRDLTPKQVFLTLDPSREPAQFGVGLEQPACRISTSPLVGASSFCHAGLLQAMQDFERSDFIELTVEQLEHCVATGESPSPDESSA
jgi:hypothetical protein